LTKRWLPSAGLVLLAAATTAAGHEPLWGETPTLFGPHVVHPEVRFGWASPGDATMFEQEYGVQYGINRWVNARLVLPAVRRDFDGEDASTGNRIGDAVLSMKYRFHLAQESGIQSSQSVVLGWKTPTGDDSLEGPDGERLTPSDQPGSGRHGVKVGYAADHERLVDSTWVSAFYSHDFGSGFRRGDLLELDTAYGRWIVRPNVADDLGVNLAFGLHGEAGAPDELENGGSADNRYQMIGVQMTPIVTKGRSQYRVGVLVPFWKNGDETRAGLELRAGWEMFF
jgi:hypothetical protein